MSVPQPNTTGFPDKKQSSSGVCRLLLKYNKDTRPTGMWLTFLFLSIFVAATHQQLILQRVLEFPWLSPFAPLQYLNQFPPDDQPINDLSPEKLNLQYNEEFQPKLITPVQKLEIENNFPDSQARIKQFKRPIGLNQQQNARFFFANSVTGNPKLKTVTFTVSSTCTRINVTSCIPAVAFAAAPGNFNPLPCRRKRDLEFDLIDENDQFPISPNEVELVIPTAVPEPDSDRYPRRTRLQISSSVLENDMNHQPAENVIEKSEKEPVRQGRFYYFWQSFATGTTVTTWSVTSTTLTQTFSPILAANRFLPCLPPGYFVCPAANNGK